MPETVRPDGARIHYEVHGEGFPVLLLGDGPAGGGIAAWDENFYHPVTELAGSFQVIAVDPRHVGRSTTAPLAPFSYATNAADIEAVLDDLGIERAHVVGAGTGAAQAWRLVHDAPGRVRSVVCQDPAGLDTGNGLDAFLAEYDEAMRLPRAEGIEGVIAAAVEAEGRFAGGTGAGPYAARLHADPEFRKEVLALRRERYIVSVVRFRDGVRPQGSAYFSVPEEWMTRFPAPLLILPGNDPLHPEGIAKRLAAEAPDARLLDPVHGAGDRNTEAVRAIVSFLEENTPR